MGRGEFLPRDKAVTKEIEATRKKKEEQHAISSAAKHEYATKMSAFLQLLKDHYAGGSSTPRGGGPDTHCPQNYMSKYLCNAKKLDVSR